MPGKSAVEKGYKFTAMAVHSSSDHGTKKNRNTIQKEMSLLEGRLKQREKIQT
jgi:hypothetical protein